MIGLENIWYKNDVCQCLPPLYMANTQLTLELML